MTSHGMLLTFEQFALSAKRAERAEEARAFRIVLLPGELLRVPKTRRSIRVIAGAAWISHNGRDHEVSAGEVLPLVRTQHAALVSAEGQPLFLEIA